MKLMIDIPEEDYKHLAYANHFKLRSYIENGTPLTALSADLKAIDRENMDEKVLIGFNMALALFNKHLGGDAE
jgi:hypothetical protein